MDNFFKFPQGQALLERVSTLFNSSRLKIKRDHGLLFVCGGPVAEDRESLRKDFIGYAHANLPNYRVFLAESSYSDLSSDGKHEFINIADLEVLLAQVSDCILIFPESVGSYAEIGFFSAGAEISRKILIANKFDFQTERSFLNDGPIHTINKVSQFAQTVFLMKDGESFDFKPVADVLSAVKLKRSLGVPADGLAQATLRERFYVVVEIFRLFPALTPGELSVVVKAIFGKSDYRELRRIISILVSARYLRRIEDEDHYTITVPGDGFVEFSGKSSEGIKAEVYETYQKHAEYVLDMLDTAAPAKVGVHVA